MELFKNKFCGYQLCDHLEIGFEKRMNLKENDKLIVEFEGQFRQATYIAWNREEGETKITLYIKKNNRRKRQEVEANKVAMFLIRQLCAVLALGFWQSFMKITASRVHMKRRGNGRRWVIFRFESTSTTIWLVSSFLRSSLIVQVFFDNGAVRFVRPPSIRLCIVQPRNPNEDRFNPTFAYRCVKGGAERRKPQFVYSTKHCFSSFETTSNFTLRGLWWTSTLKRMQQM